MTFDRSRPYDDLPDLPPGVDLETRPVMRQAIAAARALAELKGSGAVVPDQTVLINSLVLQEARASSEIENIVTTNDELYRAMEQERSASAGAREVVRYREALWHGFERLSSRPLSTNLFVEIAGAIRQIEAPIRRTPGTRIAGADGSIVYTPPEGETLIRDKLASLERFIHQDDRLDPLIKLALIHYQFEAIHPFTDGNGRTGRILNILFLVHAGLLEVPILYLSGYIIRNKGAYYQGLQAVTEKGAWEDWVLYILRAVEDTAKDTREKIWAIRRLMDRTVELVQTREPGIYSRELIEEIFRRPYCRISLFQTACGVSRQTASRYLRKLEGLGLLEPANGGREHYFINAPLWQLLAMQPGEAI